MRSIAPPCAFPFCGHPSTGLNRANQPVCGGHERVVVGSSDDLGTAAEKHGDGVCDQ